MKRSHHSLPGSHIAFAHQQWKQLIHDGDSAIDATCGNGHDTLFLAAHPLDTLYVIDIQKEALAHTRERIALHATRCCHIDYIHGCHSTFPATITRASIRLIVYNLGYLPGSNKTLTTQTATTLASLEQACLLIEPGGCISITCYPGHPEGNKEERALIATIDSFASELWSCRHYQHPHSKRAPSLLLLKKKEV